MLEMPSPSLLYYVLHRKHACSKIEGRERTSTILVSCAVDIVELVQIKYSSIDQQKHVSPCPRSLLFCSTTQRQIKAISLIHHSLGKQTPNQSLNNFLIILTCNANLTCDGPWAPKLRPMQGQGPRVLIRLRDVIHWPPKS